MRKGDLKKRSMSIAGHDTSLSLEEGFWAGLKEIAESRAMTLSALVREIDKSRTQENLSSAIRVYVLRYFRTKAAIVQNNLRQGTAYLGG
jgi:predicted DNA-binding ribbon-helix-helix protein